VVYAELRLLLFYLTVLKTEKHDKLINLRILKIKNLIYRIKAAVDADRNV